MTIETVNIEAPRRFNFRKFTRHPSVIEYRRLAAIVALVNIWIFVNGLYAGNWKQAGIYDTVSGGMARG